MIQSETIGKLAEALAKAQAVIENAKKESDNPFFKSKYADLSSIWEACRKPLTDNGLSIVQSPVFLTEHPDMVGLDTRLCHSSGEWLEGRIVMKPVKSDPQSYGSCLTYLRRYSLQSFISICAEVDDDGNAATGKKTNTKHDGAKQPNDIPDTIGQPPEENSPQGNVASQNAKSVLISDKQRKRFYTIAKESGKTDEEIKAFLREIIGSESTRDIQKGIYEYLCNEVVKAKKEEPAAAMPDPAPTEMAPAPCPDNPETTYTWAACNACEKFVGCPVWG
ncbi:MAG: ERF family protein [Smithellaceae bacterium]|jgi:hypothetical protein